MPQKYDSIGEGYNKTRQADSWISNRLFHLLEAQAGQEVVDLGCGTGNYTLALHKRELNMTGIEPSSKMLELARSRSQEVRWLHGSAEAIPLPDKSVHCVVATLTVHHWQNLGQGVSECFRILKPGGMMVLFTSTAEQMLGYWLRHYFPQMLDHSIKQMPGLNDLLSAFQKAGFEKPVQEPYLVRSDLQDQFLYCGKRDPARYLDPLVRRGISSFSDLALESEVENGLIQLERDIRSGHIQTIMNSFQESGGDYLFFKVKRSQLV